ncbi:IclR family transcriptional regulator [Halalkalicoccus jeotgali]|uniref:IclR family transcriptional regulator n=1 Tax=Halalkalicoccus jeotgali (strain DSM 18796 / CECT 7217 / JCM 14584 / KCTC 4019 / B3) TaxID=795797 RepID=D8J437_HALJB|nr:IclR family transcriptional regulator [Halalkalicoccus jeotgali]ADJ15429.1 transcriptional regulator, IclR family protein [Halalkalicoccus jeotgali B3]ELY35795.1 IclR family transcriptional regulator [Halalkalicoccus jeotgali B3]
MSTDHVPDGVRTTERSFAIVEAIQRRDGATLAELVAEFGLAKSTVYKHLRTLASHGYLEKEGERYHIGLKFHHHGEYARLRKRGYRLAGRAVRELAERTDEEADFVVENDGRTITVYESYHPQNSYREDLVTSSSDLSHSGTYYHMHCTAAGKALLAALPDERIEAVLDRWGLPARTANTITDREALAADLDRTRERGYAVADEEYVDGLCAVGVVVANPDGSPLGALGMSVPTYRRESEGLETAAAELVVETARDLERELAGNGTEPRS